jgi:hypothetical protein
VMLCGSVEVCGSSFSSRPGGRFKRLARDSGLYICRSLRGSVASRVSGEPSGGANIRERSERMGAPPVGQRLSVSVESLVPAADHCKRRGFARAGDRATVTVEKL